MRGAKKTKKGVRNQEAGDKTSRGGGQDRGTSPGKQTIQNCTEVRKQMAGKGLTEQFPNDGLVSPFDQGGFSPIPFPHPPPLKKAAHGPRLDSLRLVRLPWQ